MKQKCIRLIDKDIFNEEIMGYSIDYYDNVENDKSFTEKEGTNETIVELENEEGSDSKFSSSRNSLDKSHVSSTTSAKKSFRKSRGNFQKKFSIFEQNKSKIKLNFEENNNNKENNNNNKNSSGTNLPIFESLKKRAAQKRHEIDN